MGFDALLSGVPKVKDSNKPNIASTKKSFISTDKKEPEMTTVDNLTTVVNVATVDRMTTVVNEKQLINSIKSLLIPNHQSVYLSLYRRTYFSGCDTTDWVGYNDLIKETKLSRKTIQRAIEKTIQIGLIKRIDLLNTAENKGSKYKVNLPPGVKMTTVVS